MKKISTTAAQEIEKVEGQKLNDRFGSGRSIELVLRSRGNRRSAFGTEAAYDTQGDERGVREGAAQPDRAGNRDGIRRG